MGKPKVLLRSFWDPSEILLRSFWDPSVAIEQGQEISGLARFSWYPVYRVSGKTLHFHPIKKGTSSAHICKHLRTYVIHTWDKWSGKAKIVGRSQVLTTSATCPCPPSHFNVDDRCFAKTVVSSSGVSSVYDCVDSRFHHPTLKWGEGGCRSNAGQHWNWGRGCGRNPSHGWAWHVEQDMQKVSATLQWWSGAVEENSLSLLRMAHRTRHRSSEHKIHFPVFLSQGWTRILVVLNLWSWLIHLKFRIRVVDVTCLQYSKFPFK